jgi:hypothetical protein
VVDANSLLGAGPATVLHYHYQIPREALALVLAPPTPRIDMARHTLAEGLDDPALDLRSPAQPAKIHGPSVVDEIWSAGTADVTAVAIAV